jgi:UDP-glucose 4-epimerase
MKITVFGGAGFLGSHAADKLSLAGHEVTIFDCRQSPWLRPDQKMILGDILDDQAVARAVAGAEAVYNFAGLADLGEANDKPVETVSVNVLGNVKILEAARRARARRFVLASSLYVYGQSGGFYRCSKQACELYVEGYHQAYGLEYTILRYGSLYGPRADQRNGIYKFIREAMETGSITYSGTADAVREYINVEDAALCSVEILAPEFANANIILTGSQAMRVADLFKMIGEILGRPIACRYKADPRSVRYDLTPYVFQPRPGQKMAPRCSMDLGQGLLIIMDEIYRELHPETPPVFPFQG